MKLSRGDLAILLILVSSNLLELRPEFFILFIAILILFYFFQSKKAWVYIKRLAAILSFPLFVFLYGAIKQVEPAVSTIGILALLKYTESQNIRDRLSYYVLLIVFICGTVLLSDQVFYLAISISSLCYIFIRLGQVSGVKFKLSRLIKVMIPALFFSSFIFFLVPQVKVGNIFKYIGDRTAHSGFASSVSPGDYKKIVKDDKLYLFASYKKLPGNAYWRGVTYNYTNGRKWFQRNVKPAQRVINSASKPDFVVRKIDIGKSPLFVLENTVAVGNGNDLDVLQNIYNDIIPIGNIFGTYGLNFIEDQKSLRRPDKYSTYYPEKNISEKFRSFLTNTKGETNEETLDRLVSKFRGLNLKYSLETEFDQGNDLSRFLFEYKRGYCIHFASSFALGLRVLGVPANVVGGFYGGEINSVEKYVLVKGGNAHAWVEYWNGSRWINFDPVGALVQSNDLPRNDFARIAGLGEEEFLKQRQGLMAIYDRLESLYIYLNLKFFEFDFEKQVVLFAKIKKEILNLTYKDYLKGLYYLFGLLFTGGIIAFKVSANRMISDDNRFIAKCLSLLNESRFKGIGHLKQLLLDAGVSKVASEDFKRYFEMRNYDDNNVSNSEYIKIKKSLLTELKAKTRSRSL